MGIHLAENLCSETFCSYNNTLGYAFSQRAFWPTTVALRDILSFLQTMVTSLSSSIENWSRERRTKEEEELSEEELGLSSFFFSLSTISKWAL